VGRQADRQTDRQTDKQLISVTERQTTHLSYACCCSRDTDCGTDKGTDNGTETAGALCARLLCAVPLLLPPKRP
jgi:hypothetical protein